MKTFAGRLLTLNTPRLCAQTAAEVYANCRVLYRGYIANRTALIQEARTRRARIDFATDGELFAKAYEWWGSGLQARVLGEYAVAVFDTRRASFLATHDSLGLVPLFFCKAPNYLAFASHLEELLSLTGIESLDEEYIADYLANGTLTNARTPYTNVRRLLAGQSLTWESGRATARTTWDIRRLEPVLLSNDEEYEERFRALLHEGVRASLPQGRKVWCELSGGLDSSSVFCMAVRAGIADVGAFSVVYSSSKSANESRWIKLVVGDHAPCWYTLDGDEVKPFWALPCEICPEPINVFPSAGLFARYKQLAASHGVAVVLSGYGGDQVLCGDAPRPYHLADLFPFRCHALLNALRNWTATHHEKRSTLYYFLANVLAPSLRHFRRRRLSVSCAPVTPHWIRRSYAAANRFEERGLVQIAPRCRSIGQQYLAERIWRTGLTAPDGPTQPFDFRYPLLYRPFVEFMLGIPWDQRLRPGQDRCLQRRAMKGILPEQIRQRRDKRGSAEAEIEGLRVGTAWTTLLLHRPRIVERGYVDARLWCEAVNQARFGRIPSMRHFIAAATLEIWLRQLEDFKPGTRRTTQRERARQALTAAGADDVTIVS